MTAAALIVLLAQGALCLSYDRQPDGCHRGPGVLCGFLQSRPVPPAVFWKARAGLVRWKRTAVTLMADRPGHIRTMPALVAGQVSFLDERLATPAAMRSDTGVGAHMGAQTALPEKAFCAALEGTGKRRDGLVGAQVTRQGVTSNERLATMTKGTDQGAARLVGQRVPFQITLLQKDFPAAFMGTGEALMALMATYMELPVPAVGKFFVTALMGAEGRPAGIMHGAAVLAQIAAAAEPFAAVLM